MTDGTTQYEATPLVWPPRVSPPSAKQVDRAAARQAFAASHLSHLRLVTTGEHYWTLTKADWEAAFMQAHEHALKYVLDRFDCISFAFLAKGLIPALTGCNGIATVVDYGAHHAYSAVLVQQAGGGLTMEVAEPQIDGWADLTGKAQDYAAQRGQVLL